MDPFEFYGQGLTPLDYEGIAKPIAARHRLGEVEAFQTKWFDYRHMHLTEATYYFAHVYRDAVRRMYAKTRDVVKSSQVQAFSHIDVFQTTEATAIWLARKNFDRHGIEYKAGIDFAFHRANDRGWGYFPRPNQLYGSELTLDMVDFWTKRCTDIFQFVKHPRFSDPAQQIHDDVKAHHRWLIAQCKRRHAPERALGTIFTKRLLPQEVALEAFGEDIVKKALRNCASLGISQD